MSRAKRSSTRHKRRISDSLSCLIKKTTSVVGGREEGQEELSLFYQQGHSKRLYFILVHDCQTVFFISLLLPLFLFFTMHLSWIFSRERLLQRSVKVDFISEVLTLDGWDRRRRFPPANPQWQEVAPWLAAHNLLLVFLTFYKFFRRHSTVRWGRRHRRMHALLGFTFVLNVKIYGSKRQTFFSFN